MLDRRSFSTFLLLLMASMAQADPGLLATFTDEKQTVRRIVPTPHFTLQANESVHSQISPRFTAVYEGVLKITRAGEYVLSGDAVIEVAGNVVTNKPVKLAAGDHALKITFKRGAGPARLQLRWKSDFFIEEPIPPSALGHKKAADGLTRRWEQIEKGRVLYENLSCGACHGGEGWDLSERKAPDLSNIGARVSADWLYNWLRDPHRYREGTPMPSLLSGKDEILPVATYLTKLGTPGSAANPLVTAEQIRAGEEIFERVGCTKCHDGKQHSLAGVGSKFRSSGALALFLVNPLKVDPSGRMPQMFDPRTQAHEAERVAEFLFQSRKNNKERPRFPGSGKAKRGRELVQTRGCISCHSLQESGKPLPDQSNPPLFTKRKKSGRNQAIGRFDPQKGCLAEKPAKKVPDYKLSEQDRIALQSFLKSVSRQAVVANAPVETFYRRVRQFNCTACHSLNDKEVDRFKSTASGKIIVQEQPPTLTGAGNKLRVSWIENVLLNKKRTRPWMKVRMPHFGEGTRQIPRLFPAASGSPLVDRTPPPKMQLARAGLKTIGIQRGKVACITCHNYRGINRQDEGVVPAPDMAEIAQTLRRDWFRRWLHNPSRLQPGTSMPQFFLDLKGDARKQKIEELWAALYHQARLPLPAGLIEKQTEGTRILVGNDPVIFRMATIIPGKVKIDRAINVGLPGGTNFTFDARSARLRYAWKGPFINAGPAWNGRGGKPVSASGRSLYIAPDHFPLRIGDVRSKPLVRFRGYSLVKKYPVFRYEVDGVEIQERIEFTATQMVRRFHIPSSAKSVLFIAEKGRTYESSSGKFQEGKLKLTAGKDLNFVVRTSVMP